MAAKPRQRRVGASAAMTLPSRNELAMMFAALACEAGHAIMQARAADVRPTYKPDGSPVTQADLEADLVIRAGLADLLPDISVVTEEAAQTHSLQASERFILVDPLDGTREFVAGRDEFTVNIALIEQGAPYAGAIYAPALGRLYTGGGKARRAHVSPGSEVPTLSAMHTIAARTVPDRDWRAVASRSHLDAETRRWLETQPIDSFCTAGSSLKFCLVAEGAADVYPRLSPTMAWDIAAGHAILLAAGGAVEGLDGRPLRYSGTGSNFSNSPFVAWGARPTSMR